MNAALRTVALGFLFTELLAPARALAQGAPTVAVATVLYDASNQKELREAVDIDRRFVDALHELGYVAKIDQPICDDFNAGADHAGASLYILIAPNPSWSRATARLFRVGNRKALRTILLDAAGGDARVAVRELMQKDRWSHADAPFQGC